MDLITKIRKIEALLAGAKSEGERQAAAFAKKRLEEKIAEQVSAKPIEYTVRLGNIWGKKLFVALCKKHQLYTYRYARQKHTTTMVRVSSQFMKEVLWPEFNKYNQMFTPLADEIMQDLISKVYEVKEEDEVIVAGELPATTEATI